jgi:hypothetical protein
MTDKEGEPVKGDYYYEIVSFIVLVILSGLSHFWFILIGVCAMMLFWGALVLLIQGVRCATSSFSRRARATQVNDVIMSDSRNQVFLPGKIRQSVDG